MNIGVRNKRRLALQREYYSDSISSFLDRSAQEILGILAERNEFALEQTQRDAWWEEIVILQRVLTPYRGQGNLCFEYSIPRMGQRIDVVAIIGSVIFVLSYLEYIFRQVEPVKLVFSPKSVLLTISLSKNFLQVA
jgi:hypothetical protein